MGRYFWLFNQKPVTRQNPESTPAGDSLRFLRKWTWTELFIFPLLLTSRRAKGQPEPALVPGAGPARSRLGAARSPAQPPYLRARPRLAVLPGRPRGHRAPQRPNGSDRPRPQPPPPPQRPHRAVTAASATAPPRAGSASERRRGRAGDGSGRRRHEQRGRGVHRAEARVRPVLQPLVRREVPQGGKRRGPLRAALQALPALRAGACGPARLLPRQQPRVAPVHLLLQLLLAALPLVTAPPARSSAFPLPAGHDI